MKAVLEELVGKQVQVFTLGSEVAGATVGANTVVGKLQGFDEQWVKVVDIGSNDHYIPISYLREIRRGIL